MPPTKTGNDNRYIVCPACKQRVAKYKRTYQPHYANPPAHKKGPTNMRTLCPQSKQPIPSTSSN